MTALEAAHYRLMSQAAQQGRIHTHYKATPKAPPQLPRNRPCFVDGTEYDSLLDAAESLGCSEARIRRMIARGEGKYLD